MKYNSLLGALVDLLLRKLTAPWQRSCNGLTKEPEKPQWIFTSLHIVRNRVGSAVGLIPKGCQILSGQMLSGNLMLAE